MPPAAAQNALALDERLAGAVERITFHSDQTGFGVLQVRARGYRRLVTVVGHVPAVSVGEFVEATGAFAQDVHHGVQFRADQLTVSVPTSVEDLRRFLGSGLIKGVGPALAGRLVASFGTRVLDVIERHPDELARVHGIGVARAQVIAEAWREHRAVREIAAFLREHGIGGALLTRIYRAYGRDAVALIRENPYRLTTDIPGVTFEAADRVARRLALAPDSVLRLKAGVASVVAEAVDEGHCGLARDDAFERATALLGVRTVELDPVVDAQCAAGELVLDEVEGRACLFPRSLYGAEIYVAARLGELAQGSLPWGDLEPDAAVARAEAALSVTFSSSQRAALAQVCRSKVLVVTGGPGVGKTTLVRGLLHLVGERHVPVALCAPTGRAARRLAAVTGLEAKTVHRLLGATSGGVRRGPEAPLDCGLLVLDEASMVDVRLMTALLRALPDHAALVVVGDVDQLPSIGPGQVLADVIRSGAVPVARLDEVFRQEEASRIITAAHAINHGEAPDLERRPDSDFHFVDAAGADDVMAKIVVLARDRIPGRFGLDPVRDVQVLCPVNRGALGAYRVNRDLQAVLNPQPGPVLARGGWSFGAGDKVMQVRNDYDRDVSNGELGLVRAVDLQQGDLTVAFEERVVAYAQAELDELQLAYATTIHKAQGSEFPAVIIPVVPQHAAVLRRSLLYTGITRGSRVVVLVGHRGTLFQAVGEGESMRRCTKLEGWLRTMRG